jgi:chromosome segregation ATPase
MLSSLFAVGLFALGSVGAWYFQQWQAQHQADGSPLLEVASRSSAPIGPVEPQPTATEPTPNDMRIPVHPKSMSTEELYRFLATNRGNLESLRQRQDEIRKEELRLQLVQKDIEGQKREVEGILTQTQQTLEAAEQMLAQIQQERQSLASERQQHQQELNNLQSVKDVPDEDRQTNIKKMAELLGQMTAEEAAEVLKNLANKGNTDYVLRLLDNIEQRDAAKILDALGDPALVAELTENYQELRRFDKKTNRR